MAYETAGVSGTLAKLEGLYKEVYADGINDLIPEAAKLVKAVPFISSAKEQGGLYHQPCLLSLEHGVTYAASDAGAFALKDPCSLQTRDAQVDGSSIVLRAAMSLIAASRASNSKKAFVKATELQMENVMNSVTKRIEIASFYGRSGIGQVISTYTTNVVVGIETGHFAPGIWSGMEGCKVEIWAPAAATPRDNTGGTHVRTIVSVDNDAKTITIDDATNVAAGDLIFFEGAVANLDATPKYNEMAGLKAILTNTGTLFNISAATYNLWKGNSISYTSAGGPLSIARIMSAVSKCVARGCDEDLTAYVGVDTWNSLASDLAAQRSYDQSYDSKKGVAGVESITYYSANGKISIEAHSVVKDNDCFILPLGRLKRIGSADVGFNNPGSEGKMFMMMPSNAGVEIRCFTDQCIFLETPARAAYITGFVTT
jgi:hypothetical protein